jgi:hypothetical protein
MIAGCSMMSNTLYILQYVTPRQNEFFSSLTLSDTADDRQQISFVWNKAHLSHVRPFTSSPWDSSSGFKLPHGKEIREISTKVGTITGPLHLDKSHLSSAIPTLCHGKDELLPVKGLIHQTLFLHVMNPVWKFLSLMKLLFVKSFATFFYKTRSRISGFSFSESGTFLNILDK